MEQGKGTTSLTTVDRGKGAATTSTAWPGKGTNMKDLVPTTNKKGPFELCEAR
jgi:hypothetical protein